MNNFRYVYKFVCDLQSLLGYSPEELQAMVAQQQQQSASTPTLEQSIQDNSSATPPMSQSLKREVDWLFSLKSSLIQNVIKNCYQAVIYFFKFIGIKFHVILEH